jgi:predicted RNA binding protein YcfA (HicA-like mRNA interferase family)
MCSLPLDSQFARQEGSHRSYTKPGISRPVVIPEYEEVPVFVIKNNLKTAGISRDEYFRLLGQ